MTENKVEAHMLNEAIACHYNARVPLRDLGWAAFSKSRGNGVVPNSSQMVFCVLIGHEILYLH